MQFILIMEPLRVYILAEQMDLMLGEKPYKL